MRRHQNFQCSFAQYRPACEFASLGLFVYILIITCTNERARRAKDERLLLGAWYLIKYKYSGSAAAQIKLRSEDSLGETRCTLEHPNHGKALYLLDSNRVNYRESSRHPNPYRGIRSQISCKSKSGISSKRVAGAVIRHFNPKFAAIASLNTMFFSTYPVPESSP
jgi:hypothetical protein